MIKATVIRVFIGGALAATAGAVLAIAAVWIGYVNDVFVMNGPAIVGFNESALKWSVLGLGIVGPAAIAAGLIAGLGSSTSGSLE